MRALGRRSIAIAGILGAFGLAGLSAPAFAQDAVAYCAAGAHVRAAPAPSAFESALANAFEVGAQEIRGATFVRCRQGKLFACWVGANLDCGKANPSRRSVGASAFCAQNPNAGSVPMFATGHDTIYSWRCVGARAVAGEIVEPIDGDGYIAANWRAIP